MSALTPDEKNALTLILGDLKFLFCKEEILPEEIDTVVCQLKSPEVKKYVDDLSKGSKPETALRESFFAGKSVMSKHLFGEITPEVRENGFIDYVIGEKARFIVLELKSLFEADLEEGKTRKVLKRLKQRKLKPEAHREQILNYIKKGGEFVILTNLKEWYFFNEECRPSDFRYFSSAELTQVFKEIEVVASIKDYLEREEYSAIREELDKKFFESLKQWIDKLREVEFEVDEKRKLELVINLINKFIFIQTLDDYGVIDSRWIGTTWEHYEQRWQAKGKRKVLEEFFSEVDEWFFKYYDTELFRWRILDYVKLDDANVDLFYRSLQLVLGLVFWQTALGGFRGIMQYNFKYINEDIFGKAYETYLAAVRHDEGIYYTPTYITEYIVENSVGKVLDELPPKIKSELEKENFEEARKLVERFITIRVLDPACGSGSFLIKAVRHIFQKYREINSALKAIENKYNKYDGTLKRSKEVENKLEETLKIKGLLKSDNDRELIASILVRHIHGNDLDPKALEVAKVNIWLESIKLSPSVFRYDRLPKETNHILPGLEMNLGNGDSVVGIPEDLGVRYLADNHAKELRKLAELRAKYLADPTDPELVNEMEKIKQVLRNELDEEFKEYLKRKALPVRILGETRAFHWPLDFWYLYFDEEAAPFGVQDKGADIVLGNPPYIDSETMTRTFPDLREYCVKTYPTASGNWDMFCVFIELGILRTRTSGVFSYIVPNKLLSADYADKTRELIKRYVLKNLRDYSRVKVFDAAVYPIVFVLEKSQLEEDDKLLIDVLTAGTQEIPTVTYHREIHLRDLYAAPNNMWSPTLDPSSQVVAKIFEECPSLSDHYVVSGAATVSEAYKIAKMVEESDDEKKRDYFKFVNTGTIDKYVSLWGYVPAQFIKKTYHRPVISKAALGELSQKRLEESESEKVVIAGIGLELECLYDSGQICAGKSTVIVRGEKRPLKSLIGILNSSVASFALRRLFGDLALQGGYLRIGPPQIRRLPIPSTFLDSKENQRHLEELVDKIEHLCGYSLELKETWKEWSTRLKNGEQSLLHILESDLESMRSGEFKTTWTTNASFYPDDKQEILSREFTDFAVRAESSGTKLQLFGVQNGREILIYEVSFNNRELMLQVYHAVLSLMESSTKVRTLRDIFKKVTVPVITPKSAVNTPSIVKKASEQFRGISKCTMDGAQLDNKIRETQSMIDAQVFALYKLNQKEASVVMDSLKIPSSYQQQVREHFAKSG